MKTNNTWVVGAICLMVVLCGILASNLNDKLIGSGTMLAAAKNSSVFNIFTREKESYLYLTSPIFGFISRIVDLQTPQGISPKDVLSVTNPEPASPITNIEKSIVNIFCSQKMGNLRKTITGSGVLITKNLVLTDAHVAIWPLIADSNSAVSCLVRSGSPAKATHSVKAVFVSPEWIQAHGQSINSTYSETGQYDYAILKITPFSSSVSLTPLQLEENVPGIGSSIKATAYPANILGTKGVDTALSSQIEQLSVNNLVSFGSNGVDIIETTQSDIGQQGSSGGAITDQSNHLIGLISTVVNGKMIHSLTIGSIDRALSAYSTGGLTKIILLGQEGLENTFNQAYRSSLTSLLTNTLGI